MKFTEQEIIDLMFEYLRHPAEYLLPNVYMKWNGESDLIRVTPSRYLHEYEIKCSISDLRKEYQKERWKVKNKYIRCFSFVVPEDMVDAAKEYIRDDHGLFAVHNGWHKIRKVIKPKADNSVWKITDSDLVYFLSKMERKYWALRRQ